MTHPRGLGFRTLAFRQNLPDFNDITCAAIGQNVQLQHTNSFSLFGEKRIILIRTFHQFTKRNHRDHVAAIDTLRLPIQNIFGGIANNIGTICIFPVRWPAGATGPINEGATPTHSEHFTNHSLAKCKKRSAHQIHIIGKDTQRTTNTSMAVGHFHFRVTAKE